MLTSRSLFLEQGGLDERHSLFHSTTSIIATDCTALDTGAFYAPEAELLHHEGLSRGIGSDPAEIARFRDKYRARDEPYSIRTCRVPMNGSRCNPDVWPAPRSVPLTTVIFSHALDWTGAPLACLSWRSPSGIEAPPNCELSAPWTDLFAAATRRREFR